MIKTYKCLKTYFSTVVSCDGKNQRIEFRGGTIGSGGSSPSIFKTDNEEIQKQIEDHDKFKNGLIWLDGAKTVPVMEVSGKVDSIQDNPIINKIIDSTGSNPPIGSDPSDGNANPGDNNANSAGNDPNAGSGNDNKDNAGNTNNDPNAGSGNDNKDNAGNTNNDPGDAEIISVPEITNFQKAKNYLLKLGAVIPPTVKKDELKVIAKSMNVDFPNL